MVNITIDTEACKSCELCVSVCPQKILRISGNTSNAKGYPPVEVTDMRACIGCASCARTCPEAAIRIERG